MQQDVGVAVPDSLPLVRDVDSPEPQWPSRGEPMGVVSDTNSNA